MHVSHIKMWNLSLAAIREAGGAFAKLEVAREEEYFYKKVNFNGIRMPWARLNAI